MISRREVVTAGMLGTLAGTTAEAETSQDDSATRAALGQIKTELGNINSTLERGLNGPLLSAGVIGEIREKFTTHLRSHGKFPEFMEIGTDVMYEVYDWHVRNTQQIQISRIAEQRFAIQFMFTQLIVRWEQSPRFLGVPYDRG